jgi:hypothetical protein
MFVPRLCLALAFAASTLALGGGCATGEGATNQGGDLDAAASGVDAGSDANVLPPEDAGGDVEPPSSDGGSDGAPGRLGATAHAMAGGATVSKSPSFKAVRTLGQSPGGNGVASSPKYKFHGGLVGATQ